METKHLTTEQLAEYAEHLHNGTLQKLEEAIVEHVKECNDCAHEVLFLTELLQNEQSVIPTKQISKQNKIFPYVAFAASLIVLLGLAFLFKTFEKTTPDFNHLATADSTQHFKNKKVETINNTDSLTVEKRKKPVINKPKKLQNQPNELLAYVPNEQLESLALRFDNGILRDADVLVNMPATIIAKTSKLKLEWKNSNNTTLLIELYNNTGKLIHETETSDSVYQFADSLANGLYYWKLIDAEEFDLLFCGRIKIEP